MERPQIQLQLKFQLDNYDNICNFLDAVKPLFPEKTNNAQTLFGYMTSNYRFTTSELSTYSVSKEYNGTKDFLNAIFRKEQVNLNSMFIYNYENNVFLTLINSSLLLLSANEIPILEDFEQKLKVALGIDTQKEIQQNTIPETAFLKKDYNNLFFHSSIFEEKLSNVIQERIAEIEKAIDNSMPLAALFLIGSTLEGVLLAVALKYPQRFNTTKSAPQKDGKVLPFTFWILNNFIDVAFEVGVLEKDVKDYSKQVRDFRNYIHPNEQVKQDFSPSMNTVMISFQVLKAAINQINAFITQTP